MSSLFATLRARRERIARELAKVQSLPPGSDYTLAFLGIHSGEWQAEATLTAQALPEYGGRFGLPALHFAAQGNAALLPNGNWPHRAFLGMINFAQVRMATRLAAAARARGLRLHLIAHSNGVNAAAEWLRHDGGPVESALVIAPNTRSRQTLETLAQGARTFTLLHSDFDERLKMAWFGHRSVQYWRTVLAAGCVVELQQSGHGAQCYLLGLSSSL